jgi:Zn-dependent protease with chaperone function
MGRTEPDDAHGIHEAATHDTNTEADADAAGDERDGTDQGADDLDDEDDVDDDDTDDEDLDEDDDLDEVEAASSLELTAAGVLLPTAVLLALSVVTMFPPWAFARRVVDLPPYPVCFALYLLVGATTYVRPLQRLLLVLLFGARQPTRRQRRTLDPAWQAVRRRARVAPDMYQLLVVKDPGPTAVATGGSIVTVTRGALDTLPQRELEGVLAHELGHHVGLHEVALPMAHWLAAPVALLGRTGKVVSKVLTLAVLGLLIFVAFFVLGTSPIGILAGLALFVVGAVLLLPKQVAELLGRLIGRYSEPYADKVAVQLGYGAALSAALERSARAARKARGSKKGRRAERRRRRRRSVTQRMFATPPDVSDRLATLDELRDH